MGRLIYVPERRIVVPRSLGAGSFSITATEPTKEQYVNGVSAALSAISPELRDYVGEQAPHVADAIDSVETLYKAISGAGAGQYVTGAQASAVFDAIVGVTQNVYAVVSSITGAVSSAMGGLMEALPIMGAIVEVAFGLVDIFVQAANEAGEDDIEAIHKCWDVLAEECTSILQADRDLVLPRGTGAGGARVPADYFRSLAKAGPATFPYSVGSIFALLCAPEQQGWGGITRAIYNGTPPIQTDIPPDRKRAMWACVKGLMASWRNINFQAPSAVSTDEGRVLSPILMELIRREASNRERGNGEGEAWLDDVAKRLDNWLRTGGERSFGRNGPGWHVSTGCSMDGDECTDCEGSCYGYASGSLASTFTSMVYGWQATLNNAASRNFSAEIADRRSKNWTIRGLPGGKLIVIGGSGAAKLMQTSVKRQKLYASGGTAEAGQELSGGAKAALVLGGLGGSYLLYRGAKAIARRVRRA